MSACVRAAARVRERVGLGAEMDCEMQQRPGPSVAVLTFYKGQLEELMKARDA